ncbi:MAG: BMP family protein [Alphaproteobacteria bacterium]
MGRLVLALCLAVLAATGVARGQDAFMPGIIYALGAKFDKSFNEGAYNAFEAFEAATGTGYIEFEPQSMADFDRGVAAMTQRGATMIVVVGFYYAEPLTTIAPDYPDTDFVIIDAVAEGDNVQSILFREGEGSFLTGIVAAMQSESKVLGFVGAIDIPLIRKFIVGFEEGARHAVPEIEVLVNFVGTTPEAFNDPGRGYEVAISQFERGADVVFAGAGNSNLGVFQAADETGNFAIGVDSNQNHLYPGTVLTSMLKRVDVAVYRVLLDGAADSFQPGVVSLGLEEDAVGWAIDEHNRDLITPAMEAAAGEARAAIIAGDIVVTDPTAAP